MAGLFFVLKLAIVPGIKEEYWVFLSTDILLGRENLSRTKKYTKLFGMIPVFSHVEVLEWM